MARRNSQYKEKNPNWKGGKRFGQCLFDDVSYATYNPNRKYCSLSCALKCPIRNRKLIGRPGLSGKNNPAWRGGVKPQNQKGRSSQEYKEWRLAVFRRDNWKCVDCGARTRIGQKVLLQADHIKQWAFHPEVRYDINNGRTLCHPCHKKKVIIYSYKTYTHGLQSN